MVQSTQLIYYSAKQFINSEHLTELDIIHYHKSVQAVIKDKQCDICKQVYAKYRPISDIHPRNINVCKVDFIDKTAKCKNCREHNIHNGKLYNSREQFFSSVGKILDYRVKAHKADVHRCYEVGRKNEQCDKRGYGINERRSFYTHFNYAYKYDKRGNGTECQVKVAEHSSEKEYYCAEG